MKNDIIEIAKSAGKELLSYYKKPLNTFTKKDFSPLTEADLASNKVILDGLKKISNHPIVSEEIISEYEHRAKWPIFWLVDPLDGTKEFLSENDEFCICIALIENTEPVFGVIYAPALDELYCAKKGHGAEGYKNGFRIAKRCNVVNSRNMAISRFHNPPSAREFAKLNNIENEIVIGSALKFGRIAFGNIDIYPRFEGSKEWDIAAGHVIIKESGAKIIDLTTKQDPIYNKKSLKNNQFIVFNDSFIFEELKFPGDL